MNARSVQFSQVRIDRALGLHRGDGFELAQLSPGVNLIHGPNGSGKSTTARVIQELLWPGRTGLQRPTVGGVYHDRGHQWRIEVDAGHVQASCDGREGTAPEIGPPEHRSRYYLSLHQLIRDDDSSFAQQIANASQGGYDLDAAADALDFSTQPRLPRGLAGDLKECRDQVVQAEQRQVQVERDFHRLTALREQRELAVAASQTLKRLETAKEYRQAVGKHRAIEAELQNLPEGVARLQGNEREELDRLAKRQRELKDDLLKTESEIASLQRHLEKLRLPDEATESLITTIESLQGCQQRLSTLENELKQHRRECDEATSALKQIQQRLGSQFNEHQLKSLNKVEQGALSQFARRVDQIRARQHDITAQLGRLKRELESCKSAQDNEDADGKELPAGVNALSLWLASPAVATSAKQYNRWPGWIAIALAAGVAVSLAVAYQGAWLILLLAAIALAAAEFWLNRQSENPVADPRRVHQESFQRTGLAAPQAWTVEDVVHRLRKLIQQIETLQAEKRVRQEMAELQAEKIKLDDRKQQLDADRNRILQQLGVHIKIGGSTEKGGSTEIGGNSAIGDGWKVEDDWFPNLVDHIARWQIQRDKALAAGQQLRTLEQERSDLLAQIHAGLTPFGYGEIGDSIAAAGMIDDLNQRRSDRQRLTLELGHSRQQIEDRIRPELERIEAQRQAIFRRMAIDEAQEPVINRWLEQLDAYNDLQKQLTEQCWIRDDRKRQLAEHAEFLEFEEVELEAAIEKQQALADKRDELTNEISRIEHAMDEAKRGHELAEKLEAKEEKQAELADERERCRRAAVGAALVRWVRQVAIERSRPEVFRRANQLLVTFTHGHLQLDLDDQNETPQFLARSGSEPARPVDRLSIGERVQLIMAVRLAFIEQNEATQLPLIIDEALGTSDDERAAAIIDTVIEIARGGRQVFYFTAQPDEVGKWKARLIESGVEYGTIDLARVRNLAAAERRPLKIAPVEQDPVPAPDGRTHEEYGRLLNVSAIDCSDTHLARLHVWHLIDDVYTLHRLLGHGIQRWRQLDTVLKHSGGAAFAKSESEWEPVRARAQAIQAAVEFWKIGRGRPVDREVLLESQAVSDLFIDQVSELADRCNGQARQVLKALEARRVPRWRTDNTDALRRYFEQHGYLSHESILTSDQIYVRLIGVMQTAIQRGWVTTGWLQRVVAQLPAGDGERP